MVTPEIISYVSSERAKGTLEGTIKATLIVNGWNAADVDEAMAVSNTQKPAVTGAVPGSAAPVFFTPDSQAPSDIASDKKIELKKYRRRQTNIIFLWSMAVVGFFILANFILVLVASRASSTAAISSLLGALVIWLIPTGLVMYLTSYIAAKTSYPDATKGRHILNIILGVFLSLILAFIIGIALLFASCLFLAGSGNF